MKHSILLAVGESATFKLIKSLADAVSIDTMSTVT